MSEPGPIVIGGVGGSGTGVVAQVLQAGGVHMGGPLNPSWDALAFVESYHKWVEVWGARRVKVGTFSARMNEREDDFWRAIQAHRETCRPGRWGWKLTGAIHFVGLISWVCMMKGLEMTFVHVVRDGRDIAYSRSQQQHGDHGDALLAGQRFTLPPGADPNTTVGRRMKFWSIVNDTAAGEGSLLPKGRYVTVTFEWLISSPLEEVARLYNALGIDAPPEVGAAIVHPLASLGRWRRAPEPERAVLNAVGRTSLARFGYVASEGETVEHTIEGRLPLDPAVTADLEAINKLIQRDLRPSYPMNANE